VCSLATLRLDATTKRPAKFQNVTDVLTTITIVVGGVETTYSIFDPALYSYFWNYDNHGLRLAQIRFYPTDCPQ